MKTEVLADKFVRGVTLFSANPTWTNVGSNSDLCGERTGNNPSEWLKASYVCLGSPQVLRGFLQPLQRSYQIITLLCHSRLLSHPARFIIIHRSLYSVWGTGMMCAVSVVQWSTSYNHPRRLTDLFSLIALLCLACLFICFFVFLWGFWLFHKYFVDSRTSFFPACDRNFPSRLNSRKRST